MPDTHVDQVDSSSKHMVQHNHHTRKIAVFFVFKQCSQIAFVKPVPGHRDLDWVILFKVRFLLFEKVFMRVGFGKVFHWSGANPKGLYLERSVS